MKRPARLDLSVRWEAAKALCVALPADTYGASADEKRQAMLDLARVLNEDLSDPYAMTQKLEKNHGWRGSMALVNAMQQAPAALDTAHRAATEQWVIAHHVTPRFALGKRVTVADTKDPDAHHEGEIVRIETDLAVYVIHVPALGHRRDAATGEVQGFRCAFEDCHPIDQAEEAPAAEPAAPETPQTNQAVESNDTPAAEPAQPASSKRRARKPATEETRLTLSHVGFVLSFALVAFTLALGLAYLLDGGSWSPVDFWDYTVWSLSGESDMRGHIVDAALFIALPLLVVLAVIAKWLPRLGTLKWMTRSAVASAALIGSAAIMNPALNQNTGVTQSEEQSSEKGGKSKKKKAGKGGGLDLGSAVAGVASAKSASDDASSETTERRKKKRR